MKQRYCHYPVKALADNAYGTRGSRRCLKANNIAFGGKPLGRPTKRTPQQRAVKHQQRVNAPARIPIEGTMDRAKTVYGLSKIPAHRKDISQVWVRMIKVTP